MGRLVLWMQQTLDGYAAGPNGELDWPTVADDTHTYFNERIESTAGAFVYGRRTVEMMAGYWPTAVDSDHANTARFARTWVSMPKLVVSGTLSPTAAEWKSSVVDSPEALAGWKERIEGGLVLIGGAALAADVVRLGLVDEHHVFVHPVILGGGQRLYPPTDARIELDHISSTTFGGGVVLHRHAARTV